MYRKWFKRGLDAVLALLGLVVLSPVFLVLACWIRLDSEGPVFFRQKRYAKDGKLFEIFKFRTMYTDAPKDMPTHLLENPEACITRSGRFLRKTSLDELPQIINILKGDMAIIGPRPALWNQYDLMALRHANGSASLRPGLSGWAQIHGRDELPIEIKARYDGEYAETMSFSLDMKCLFGTVFSVFRQEGIHEGRLNSARESDR